MQNRKGQIGQTMTWTVATVIIIVVVMLFIFIVGSLSFSDLDSVFFREKSSSVAVQQTLFALLEKDIGGRKIVDLIKEGQYGLVSAHVGPRLTEFGDRGLECDFFVFDETGSRRNELYVGDSSGGDEASVFLDSGVEVKLKCRS